MPYIKQLPTLNWLFEQKKTTKLSKWKGQIRSLAGNKYQTNMKTFNLTPNT